MYLKKLTENKLITVVYEANGAIQKIRGRVYRLNLKEQNILLKDDQQASHTIRLSCIRHID
ncbi:hypothetical protein [Neobacillus fumarioli]|uniref:hypothetical protein n=1 Tax=Neobacillus fumarioli TaxID=105229 RepID=UPI00082FFB09|nr:hypothetical protein [Neobacillus fumarioli]